MKLASISFMSVCVQMVMSCEFGCHTFQSLGQLLHHVLLNGFDGEGFRQSYTISILFAVVMMLHDLPMLKVLWEGLCLACFGP